MTQMQVSTDEQEPCPDQTVKLEAVTPKHSVCSQSLPEYPAIQLQLLMLEQFPLALQTSGSVSITPLHLTF